MMGLEKISGSEVVGSITEDTLDQRGFVCAADGSDWGKEIHSFLMQDRMCIFLWFYLLFFF